MQFKVENVEEPTLEKFVDYLEEDVLNGIYTIEKEYLENDETKNIEKLYITDLKTSYIFAVDKDYNLEGPINNQETEATYELKGETEEGKLQLLVVIKNSKGVEYIYNSDKRIDTYGKQKVAIDFEAERNSKYEFKVKLNEEEEKTLILDTSKIDTITISETTSYAYPILKETGIEIGKYISIQYTEENENYYSLDNGKTWKRYDKSLEIMREGEIKAKSITGNENEINYVCSKDIKLNLASDALPTVCYDGDETTGATKGTLYIDEQCYNKEIYYNSYYYVVFYFYDENNKYIKGITANPGTGTVTIPENSQYVIIEGSNGYAVYEVGIKE